jgi:hypothetical protein
MVVFPSLHRRLTQFLRLAAILLATFFATARAADTQRGAKPNIIFLLIDALGFADCGFNGGKDIRTPNIDRLAHGGAILDSLYVQPVCPPIPNRRRNRRSTPRGQSAAPAAVASLPREFGSCDRCGPPFTLSVGKSNHHDNHTAFANSPVVLTPCPDCHRACLQSARRKTEGHDLDGNNRSGTREARASNQGDVYARDGPST